MVDETLESADGAWALYIGWPPLAQSAGGQARGGGGEGEGGRCDGVHTSVDGGETESYSNNGTK
jgi:hypothetical protein